jgi:hypothetical protein
MGGGKWFNVDAYFAISKKKTKFWHCCSGETTHGHRHIGLIRRRSAILPFHGASLLEITRESRRVAGLGKPP